MQPCILQHLRERRTAIKREWLTLLRAEPVATPLGNPEALAHLIDRTLDEVFAELSRARPAREESTASYAVVRGECGCGRNPLLAYFLAGERALLEALIWAQGAHPAAEASARHTEFTELYLVLRRIARREVRLFCSVCQLPRAEEPTRAGSSVFPPMSTAKIAFAAASAAALLALTPARAAEGSEVYAQNCASCHGQDGAGHTKAGRMLGAKDLGSSDYQKTFTDDEAFKSLKEGLTVAGKQKMKPFAGKLSDDDLKAVVTYVRTLKK
ncbi:MAG TPA: cytochrome c [Opitutaceae bacterium]|nr:cytochrome c [Opitutaceae bacterium]